MPVDAPVKFQDKRRFAAFRYAILRNLAFLEKIAGRDDDIEFLGDFPDQRGFWAFATLHLASGKLPQAAVTFRGPALLQQNAPMPVDQGDRHHPHRCRDSCHRRAASQPFLNSGAAR